jgi:hypothetical protein
MTLRSARFAWPSRQRGAFAFLAMSLLLVVIAFAIRLLLGMSQTTSYDSPLAAQSVKAAMLAESGVEKALTSLRLAGLNSSGIYFDATECSATKIGGGSMGPFSLGDGTFEYTTLSPGPSGCGSALPNTCSACTIQVVGKVGQTSRTIDFAVGFQNSQGITGFGKNITQKIATTAAPTAVVFNLSYRRLMAGGGGGQATVTPCAGCNTLWNIESSSGSPSIGGEAIYSQLASAGSHTVTQTLDLARNYAEVGAVLEQNPGSTLGLVGSYSSTSGGNGTNTVGLSGTNSGETTNGASTSTSWCYGGDTLIFGYSARSSSATDTLTSVTFGNAPALTRIQRQGGYDQDIYSELWYVYNAPFFSAAGATSSGTTITVADTTGLAAGTRLAVQAGTGRFAAGTTVTSITSATTFEVSAAPTTALSGGASVVCGGTCALFDHTVTKTGFSIVKSAGTSQWASGFVCLTGVDPAKVNQVQNVYIRPTLWSEPF